MKQYIYHRYIMFQQMKEEEHENDWYVHYFSKRKAIFFFSTQFLDPKFDIELDDEIYKRLTCSQIVNCCNDLLLCKCDRRGYYVCNPVTKWWIKIPILPRCYDWYTVEGFVCESYYKVEGNKVTFNRGHRFRIVRLAWWDKNAGPKSEFEVVVFSSETGQWSSKKVSCLNGASFDSYYCRSAVAHGGRLFFKGWDNIMMYDPFNNEGQCQTIRHPTYDAFIVGVCCGKIRISAHYIPEKISVWELEEDFSWRLLHHTVLPMPEFPQGPYYHTIELQAFHPHHGDIVFYHYLHYTFQANLKTKKVQIVANCNRRAFYFKLVSLDLPLWPTPPSIYNKNLFLSTFGN